MPYRVAPARPPKIPDGPDHIGAAQRVARRNRRIGLLTTAIVLGIVVASVMVHDAHRARQEEVFEGARADLEACLLGPEPLASSASCDLRLRRRQLTAMRVAPIDRLAAAHDVVLYDDLVMNGVMQDTPTLRAFRVYGGKAAARVFLVTSRGTWFVDVTESGGHTP